MISGFASRLGEPTLPFCKAGPGRGRVILRRFPFSLAKLFLLDAKTDGVFWMKAPRFSDDFTHAHPFSGSIRNFAKAPSRLSPRLSTNAWVSNGEPKRRTALPRHFPCDFGERVDPWVPKRIEFSLSRSPDFLTISSILSFFPMNPSKSIRRRDFP